MPARYGENAVVAEAAEKDLPGFHGIQRIFGKGKRARPVEAQVSISDICMVEKVSFVLVR